MLPLSITTLTQPVQQRALHDPDHPAVIFIHDDGSEEKFTCLQFHNGAQAYARALQAAGVQAEDLVILVLHQSPTLLTAFWGALYLGAIASIFPYLTEKLDPVLYMERIKELVTHSGAKAVITFEAFKEDLSNLLTGASCSVLSTADIPSAGSEAEPAGAWPEFDGAKIAFLQHSSGTTGLQKGVALSHRAVLNQVEAYGRAIDLRAGDVIVSWLPLYHDMGLIAGFVMPLVAGVPLVLMSPFKWVRDPKILLQALHRHPRRLCWLPNFAYNHTARVVRPQDLAGLDLSGVRAFINCSEPVFLDSHQVFLKRLAACGVQAEALQVCYAMAENTFAVTQTPPGQPTHIDWVITRSLQEQRWAEPATEVAAAVSETSTAVTPMVSCGYPIDGTKLRIVDEHGKVLLERQVGEIALRSSCMLTSYYRRPEITAQAVRNGWYHTGDMGYLAGGQLYITGRKKDLIIVGGKNIYPQDLEAIANTLPGLVPGRSTAFGMFDPRLGSENIVMVCELEDDGLDDEARHTLEMELRRRVVQRSEVALSDIRLVSKRWLIKTSSGKISRASNREKYVREFLQSEER